MKRSPLKRKSQKSKSKLKEKAWYEFSRYIRLKYSDSNGNCTCVTCGARKMWKELQAGHVLDGRNNSILFDENIVYPQCYTCNCMLHGNKEAYIPWFIDKFGRDKYDEKVRQKKQTLKYSESELEEMRLLYKQKANSLEAGKVSNIVQE